MRQPTADRHCHRSAVLRIESGGIAFTSDAALHNLRLAPFDSGGSCLQQIIALSPKLQTPLGSLEGGVASLPPCGVTMRALLRIQSPVEEALASPFVTTCGSVTGFS